MKKVVLVLMMMCGNVFALDNEDCMFVDGLGQEVTEIKVSCEDKRAEYTYSTFEGIKTFERDLLSSKKVREQVPGLMSVIYEYDSVHINGDCNISNFVSEGTLEETGLDMGNETSVWDEIGSRRKIVDGQEYFYYEKWDLIDSGNDLQGMDLCVKDVDSSTWTSLSWGAWGIKRRYAVNSGEYIWILRTTLQDLFEEQTKDKYYGEFRAVPLEN